MKTLQVNLQVQADIAAAQRNIQSLAQLLNQIGNKSIAVDSGPLKEAQEAAQQLQVHLQNAVNVNTGKLNLNALNTSLKQSGTSLNQLAMNLQNAGTKGQQAFLKLAQVVSSAEVPMYKMNSHLKKIGVTLLNTIKWQVASNLIHGVQGAFQGVVIHAKELNRALNDIQIVTGYSTSQMAELASTAREAAKELNTTTVEYSKAALIFYQQGLSRDVVEERTNTVIKLAHVTGQTAEKVSSQMTAIWNNFDDGSHKLEYYADVITKLGAATASSSSEIADGLQKFAAIADTVGLSYEKAAASLATVVAETRQSPEVVGTAFKTMLARIEGLQLGETLEDGVGLNKYSEALQTVGVNVLDAKGNLLEMDDILDSLGEKWGLLGEQTKVALAQTVAGVRQYSQFIAWMDNYNKVMSNQNLAEKSSGSLEEQAQIWSDSYQAAAKRVEQTKTELYEKIFDDKALIRLEDSFGKILKGIETIMDSAGGFIPLILQITASLGGILIPMLFNGFRRITNHISILTGQARASMESTQNSFNNMLENILLKENGWSETTKKQIELTLRLSQAKQELAIASKNMSESYKQEATSQMQVYEAQVSNIQKILEEKQALEDDIAKIKERIQAESNRQIGQAAGMKTFNENHQYQNQAQNDEILDQAISTTIHTTNKKINAIAKDNNINNDQMEKIKNNQEELSGLQNKHAILTNNLDGNLEKIQSERESLIQANNEHQKQIQNLKIAQGSQEEIERLEKEQIEIVNQIQKNAEKESQIQQEIKNNEAEIFQKKKERALLYKDINKNTQEELDKLLSIQNVQKDINQQKQDSNNAVIGTVKGFSSQESYGATGQAAELTDQMRSTVQQTMNAVDVDGELKLENSITNMEKLCTEFSKYKILLKDSKDYQENFRKSIEKVKGTSPYQKLQKELQNYEKQLKNIENAQKNNKGTLQQNQQYINNLKDSIEAVKNKIGQQLAPTINDMKNKLLELAKQAGLTGQDFENFKEELNNLAKAGNIEGLQEKFKNFDVAVNNTQTEVFDLVNSMRGQFEKLNIPTEALDNFINKMIELELLTDEEAKKLKGLPDSFKPPVDKVTKFSNALGKVSSVVGQLSMALSGIKSVAKIWTDDDADIFEKVSTTLMSLTMIIPVLTSAMSAGKTMQKLFTKSTEENTKKTEENTGAQLANAAAAQGEAAAKTVKSAVEKYGWKGAAIGLAVAGTIVAGLTALQIKSANAAKETEKLTQKQKEQDEQSKNLAKSTIELANKWQEEANKMDLLIKKYKELNEKKKDTLEVQKEILDQAPNLIKAYKEMNESFKTSGGPDLTAQISELEKAVAAQDSSLALQKSKEIEASISTGTVQGIEQGAKVANAEFNKTLQENKYVKYSGAANAIVPGSVNLQSFEGKLATYFSPKSMEDYQIINKIIQVIKDKKLDLSVSDNAAGILLGIDKTDPEKKSQNYKDLTTVYNTILSDQELGNIAINSFVMKQFKELLDDIKDSASSLEEYTSNESKFEIEGIIQEKKIDITDIVDYKDYNKKVVEPLQEALANKEYQKAYADTTEAEKENIKQQIKAWADGKEVLSEIIEISDKFAYVEQQFGEETRHTYEKIYGQLSEEGKEVFKNMNLSLTGTADTFYAEFVRTEEKMRQESISTNLTAISEAKKAFSEATVSAEDWAKVSSLNWEEIYKKTGIAYKDFLQFTYQEQEAFLEKMEQGWGIELPVSIQRSIAEAQKVVKNSGISFDSENFKKFEKINEEFNEKFQYTTKDYKTGEEKTLSGAEAYEAQMKNFTNFFDFTKPFAGGEVQITAPDEEDIGKLYEEYTKQVSSLGNVTKASLNAALEAKKTIEEGENSLQVAIRSVLTNVETLSELNQRISDLEEQGFNIDNYYASVESSLINLGNQYENCSGEVLKFQQAIASGSDTMKKSAEIALRNAIEIGELAKGLDLESKVLEEQAKELISVNNLSKENYAVANKVAVLNQSMNKGLKDLVDNWEDYKEALKSSEKGTQTYAETALKLKTSLAQLLGVLNVDYIPSDFLELPGVMELIEKAVKGDIDSINELGTTMAKSTIEAIEFEEGLTDSTGKLLSKGEFGDLKEKILKGITDFSEGVQNGTIKAGESINSLSGNWVNSLNEMAAATEMSIEEMNSLLNELGVQAEVTTQDVTMETTVPEYTTYKKVIDPESKEEKLDKNAQDGFKAVEQTYTVQTNTRTVQGKVPVAQINMGKANKGKKPVIKYAGRNNPSKEALTKSDSSSSSSSKSSPTTKAASHSHEVNRYSNEENAVNGLTKEYEKLGKVKDQAFGKGRISAMEQELKALKDLKKASGDYLEAIAGAGNADKAMKAMYSGKNIGSMISNGELGGTIRADYNSLYSGLSASGKGVEYTAKDSNGNEWLASDNYSLANFNSLFGTNLQFSLDSFGNLQNKDSILNLLQNLKNNENNAYSSVADPSASSTTEYNKRIAYLEEIKSRIEQYGSTANLLSEKSNEYLDYISSIQDKNAELISSKMENSVNLSQKTIQKLERSIKVLGDSIYKNAEAMQGWYNANFKDAVDADKQKGNSAIATIEDVNEKVKLYEQNPLDENAISPEKAAEILSSAEDTLDGVVDDLLSRIQAGKEYYGNVLNYWNEKLETVNQNIENNIKVFDHLQNILNLLGQSTDYEKQGQILQRKFQASQENYNSRKRQAEDAKNAYEAAVQERDRLKKSGISAEALAAYEEGTLQKALNDYQTKADAMYSALEETIDLSNQIFENEVNKIMQESEKRLTGKWGSFDDLDSAMKRQQSVTEEYLTKTNQLYETNTMLRKLSQDIDKTDSQIAKNKLKAFSDEIEAMQKQEKLSKSDLEIAKARYEVLQAQIALEEAQNAKSTVRLQRDNEGNYGYIYTADQEKIENAEQTLADKENNLYNTLLKQAEEYGQKSIQMRKEWQAEMQALITEYQENNNMSIEEFLMKQADINNKYREMEIAYQKSFQTANTWLNQVGAEGQTEAWVNSFDEIITQHRIFNDDSSGELDSYNEKVNSVADDLTNTVNDKFRDFKEQRDIFTAESKTSNKELEKSIDEVTQSVSDLSKSVTQKGGLADSMSSAMREAQNLSNAFISQYDSLQKLINKYSDAANEANKLYAKTADLINVQVALNHANNGATSVSWGPDGVQATYGSNSNSKNNKTSNNQALKITNSNGDNTTKEPYYRVRQIDTDYVFYVPKSSIKLYQNSNLWTVTKIDNFKSGGYTGIWPSGKTGLYTGSWNGPDLEENGKLAFLHQKELVLNADDTENILDAVKLIRQISQTIDLQAMAYGNSTSGLAAAHLASNNQTLQQEVTIHAEFPNATDHNEIEEAFNNLVNRASQYANRY